MAGYCAFTQILSQASQPASFWWVLGRYSLVGLESKWLQRSGFALSRLSCPAVLPKATITTTSAGFSTSSRCQHSGGPPSLLDPKSLILPIGIVEWFANQTVGTVSLCSKQKARWAIPEARFVAGCAQLCSPMRHHSLWSTGRAHKARGQNQGAHYGAIVIG